MKQYWDALPPPKESPFDVKLRFLKRQVEKIVITSEGEVHIRIRGRDTLLYDSWRQLKEMSPRYAELNERENG